MINGLDTKNILNWKCGVLGMNKLDALLACLTNERIIVQMHNYPDQDALACALGLQVLLELKGKKAIIGYQGFVDKDNTLKMMELLGIEICEQADLNLTPEDEIIIVDGQKGNVNVTELNGNEVACIDHHRVVHAEKYRFQDIRVDVGACASIIASYFFENNIAMPQNVATALLYGIKMDTHNMTRGVSALDLEMFYKLYPLANREHLHLFENYCLRVRDLEAYRMAIETLRVVQGLGIAAVVENCSEALMGAVSDFLITISNVHITLVYSYRANGVKFSLRSSDESMDASEVIRKALEGLGDGGGHADMAAGFIPNVPNETIAMQYAMEVESKLLELIKKRKKNK